MNFTWVTSFAVFVSPFSPPRNSKVVWKVAIEVFLIQRVDSDGDIHVRNMGTVKGDVVMARVEALESQLAPVTQLLMGLSGSIGGSYSHGFGLREDNNNGTNQGGGGEFLIRKTLESQQQFIGVYQVFLVILVSSQLKYSVVFLQGSTSGQSRTRLASDS